VSLADLRARAGTIEYARVGDAHVAYRVLTGPRDDERDVVFVTAGTASMEAYFDDPITARLLDGLSQMGRLVVFDRRGIGLSDPLPDSDESVLDLWRADLEAVVAATVSQRPAIVTSSFGGSVAFLYHERHPGNVGALVMLEPAPSATRPFRTDLIRSQIEGQVDTAVIFAPSRVDEPGFREWFERAGAQGASPGMATRAYPTGDAAEIEAITRAASGVRVPTLVLRRPAHPYSPPVDDDQVVALVPDAVRVDLPGVDLLVFGNEVDALLAEVSLFLTGETLALAPDRSLAAILFSDLVSSTERAAALGDAHWRRLLDRHDTIVRSTVTQRGGTVVKVDGDGVLAVFGSATSSIRAARELQQALGREGLTARAAVHVGDVDARGDDVSGLAVNIAARIMTLASAGELLVSAAVPPVVAGSGFAFDDRGEHELKGVPGVWRLYALTDA
jgi:class 3 adenylate cyclase/alpha-beta hydrolase superfamily lysophospholipase